MITSDIYRNYEFQHNFHELSNKTIFLTGGTGFFGLWLLSLFQHLNEHMDVKVFVLSRNPSHFIARHPNFRNLKWLTWITGDVRSINFCEQNFDYIIHGAAETTSQAHNNHFEMLDTIISGGANILQLANELKVKKTLLISSGAVYGRQSKFVRNVKENDLNACDPLDAFSAYGEGKRCMELIGAIHHKTNNLHVNYARCFTFMGPGIPVDGHFAFGNFVKDVLDMKPITVKGDGSAIRSYLHGADLAVWLVTILLFGNANEAYNVGSDKPIKILELANLFSAASKVALPINIMGQNEHNLNKMNIYVPDIQKIRGLGCEIRIPIEQGIYSSIEFEKYKNV